MKLNSDHIAREFNDPATLTALASSFAAGATGGAIGTAGAAGGIAGAAAGVAGTVATSTLVGQLATGGVKSPTPAARVTREIAASEGGSRKRKGISSTILAGSDSGNQGTQAGGNTLLGGG